MNTNRSKVDNRETSARATTVPMTRRAIIDKNRVQKLGVHTDPEQLLLALILTHGIITKATWEAIGGYAKEELSNAMWALTRRKLVVARSLFPGTTYFMLSQFAASSLELPLSRAKAIEGDGRVRAFARLLFFTQYFPLAVRESKDNVSTQLGQSIDGLPLGFFTHTDRPEWLGFLRIDGHMMTVPMRSARSLRDDVLRLVTLEHIRVMLKQKRFEWFWVTARQSRADAVMTLFKTFDVGKAPVTMVAMSELLPLIPSKERRT